MTPDQAAYRAGCLYSEAEHRFAKTDGFSPTTYGDCARHPWHMPVHLRHVWPKVMADPDLEPLLDWLEHPSGPLTPAAQSCFSIGYYHQKVAGRLPADFPAKLTRLREAAGLSVAQLAEATGLSRQAVYDLEAGRYRPTWDTVQQLAKALNTSTDTFRDPVK